MTENRFLEEKDSNEENPNMGLDLLITILGKADEESLIIKDIESLKKEVTKNFFKIFKVLERIPIEFYFQLKDLNEKIEEFSLFPKIFNKSVVGIGGRFSSGKSAFLNSLFEEKLLPVNTIITTSFPTYIISGKINNNYLINSFSQRIDNITKEDLLKLSHQFHDDYKIHLSKIVDRIFIENNALSYDNIVLLDTPGYNADSVKNKDRELAMAQLNKVNYIVWVMDIDSGSLKQDEIDFIKSLQEGKKYFFILNKADTKNESEQYDVYQYVKEQLDATDFDIEGLAVYTSNSKYIGKNRTYYGDRVTEFFQKINKKPEKHFLEEIGDTFNRIIEEVQNVISSEGREVENERRILAKNKEIILDDINFKDVKNLLDKCEETVSKIEKAQKILNSFKINYSKILKSLYENIEKEFSLKKGSLISYSDSIDITKVGKPITNKKIRLETEENRIKNQISETIEERIHNDSKLEKETYQENKEKEDLKRKKMTSRETKNERVEENQISKNHFMKKIINIYNDLMLEV